MLNCYEIAHHHATYIHTYSHTFILTINTHLHRISFNNDNKSMLAINITFKTLKISVMTKKEKEICMKKETVIKCQRRSNIIIFNQT